MKTKTLRNSFLIVVVTFTFPSVGQAQNPMPSKEETIKKPTEKAVFNPNLMQVRRCGPPIHFKPFEMVDPQTRRPIARTATIELPNGTRVPADEYYDQLNKFEKWLTENGCSLRNTPPKKKTVIAEIPLNRDLIEGQVQAAPTRTSATAFWGTSAPAWSGCSAPATCSSRVGTSPACPAGF